MEKANKLKKNMAGLRFTKLMFSYTAQGKKYKAQGLCGRTADW